jgi:hypothetical protein
MKLCHYAECHFAEYRDLFIGMLNIIMLSVVRLNDVMLSAVAPFCPWQAFRPSLILVNNVGAYLSETPFRYYTLGTHKHQTRMKKPARDKP